MLNLNAMLLGNQIKVTRLLNGVAAGTTEQPGTSLDMAGFDGCLFMGFVGALTNGHTTALKAQQSSDNGSSDGFSDLAGSSVALADGDSNKVVLLDIYKPEKGYLKPVFSRGGANAVIDGIVAIQYASKTVPLTHGTTVKALKTFVTPPEGTA